MSKKSHWTRKISLGIFIFATGAGTTSAILIPILTRKTSTNQQDQVNEQGNLNSLAHEIIGAPSAGAAQEKAQLFYGLKYEANTSVVSSQRERQKYTSANTLAKYIFKIKNTHDVEVVGGQEKTTSLQEILFIFKDKKTPAKRSLPNTGALWHHKKIDTTNDDFALLTTFYKKWFVKAKFEVAKTTSLPSDLNDYILKTKLYDKIKLFFAFKNATPTSGNFTKYNMGQDDDVVAIDAFKDYLLSLQAGDSMITREDLKRTDNFHINFKKGTPPAGEIIFKFDDYEATKKITNFKHVTLEEAQVLANAQIRHLRKEAISALPTMKNRVSGGVAPTPADFNQPVLNGFTFEFKSATPVGASGESTITLVVKVDPFVEGSKSKEMTFVVSGFLAP